MTVTLPRRILIDLFFIQPLRTRSPGCVGQKSENGVTNPLQTFVYNPNYFALAGVFAISTTNGQLLRCGTAFVRLGLILLGFLPTPGEEPFPNRLPLRAMLNSENWRGLCLMSLRIEHLRRYPCNRYDPLLRFCGIHSRYIRLMPMPKMVSRVLTANSMGHR